MLWQSHLLCLSAMTTTDWPLLSSTFKFIPPKHNANLTRYKNIVDFQTPVVGALRRTNFGVHFVCNAIRHDQLKQDMVAVPNEIVDRISAIKAIFDSMGEGEISASPYDTARVSLIENVNGNTNVPQFPSCLEWIASHQLEDGSWGDSSCFGARDRMINTLACVVALKSWNVYPDKLERGITFLKRNMYKLKDDDEDTLLIGFEVAFPSLLKMAEKLDIKVVEDSTLLEETYAKRELKLKKIPNEVLHTVPTTLLHSLEGMTMAQIDWKNLLKLQIKDGSFFHSPSSTAFAFMQTKDEYCLSYLQKIVQKFNGGVPCIYPVEIFEKIWVVDRLQRLGISRYFGIEIKECLNYVNRFVTDKGIGLTKYCTVPDIDITCMSFRLLRLHGYHVYPDMLRHFEEGEDFVCFAGQLKQGVSDTFNLLRASQLMFPGETTLQRAKKFSYKFLKEKRASNRLVDRWLITKDLPGEVGYALDVPWYASLPRVETRFYLDQYGGDNDVWIGKTFYRMPYISNNKYLELAKLDFKRCQAQHQLEWKTIQQWCSDSNFRGLQISKEALLLEYFLAAASIYEPERSNERIGWAKSAVLIKIIASYFNDDATCIEDRMTFINKLNDSTADDDGPPNNTSERLVGTLVKTINQLSVVADGRYIHQQLYRAWLKWIKTLNEEGCGYLGKAELLVQTLYLCSGRHPTSDEPLTSHDQQHLIQVTNNVCNKLRHFQDQKSEEYVNRRHANSNEQMMTSPEIENGMQELVQLVYQHSPADSKNDACIKHACLSVAKTFYYTAYCDAKTIDSHITKVLFERVE